MADADETAAAVGKRLNLLEAEVARLRHLLAGDFDRSGLVAAAGRRRKCIWAVKRWLLKLRLIKAPSEARSGRSTRFKNGRSPMVAEVVPHDGSNHPCCEVSSVAEPEAASPHIVSSPNLTATAFDAAILERRPRILIDITPTARLAPFTGGIARVARELAKAGVKTGLALPVRIVEGEIHSYYSHPLIQHPITLTCKDIYVIADVFWFFLPDYRVAVAKVRAAGAKVALIVHDIGPIRFPALFREDMPPLFKAGFLELLRQSDFCLGVSHHVERDVCAYLSDIGFRPLRPLAFGHCLLGATKTPFGTAEVRAMFDRMFDNDNVFLSVGTVEPRKGYNVTLDACELAWLCGADFSLVLIGRYGWSAEALRTRIEQHPELNQRLFWIQDANDTELAFAYTRCRSLIQSSLHEGFCLPVSEACLFGAPVICSDLPVIREIAGSSVRYFCRGSHEQLARRINEALAKPPAPADFPVRSWAEVMQALVACLSDPLPPNDEDLHAPSA